MQIVYQRCAGLDVHKKMMVACALFLDAQGNPVRQLRTFGTTWRALLELVEWLNERGCTHVAMESTGVYWRPIFNALEDDFEVLLVNAHHIKTVPGRKTDVKDAEWIADLLQHGLLKASFIPPRPQRELRELTRGRKNLVEERSRVINRIQKILEDSNIKLSSVVSNIVGTNALRMLEALLAGERDVEKIAQLADGRLKASHEQLVEALHGELREHHRFLLEHGLKQIKELNAHIESFDQEIERRIGLPPDPDPMPSRPETSELPGVGASDEASPSSSAPRCGAGYEGYAVVVQRLDAITGISRRLAHVLVAEIGPEVSRFPTEGHLASWVGICPANKVSAGKRLGGGTSKGNIYVRNGLVEAAQAAAHSKGTFLGALFRRLKARLGYKKAIMALAHRILIILYHMLRDEQDYREYGETKVEQDIRQEQARRAVRQLKQLGFDVTLEQAETA